MHQACNSGYLNIINFLLELNANPELSDSLGRNAVLYSACAPGSDGLKFLLMKRKDLVNSKDYTGRSALHYAVFNPHSRQADIIKELIEAGLDINGFDDERKTPLHHACEAGKAKAIRCLVK